VILRCGAALVAALLSGPLLRSQPAEPASGRQSALLDDSQLAVLYTRTIQLMEATAVSTPELSRAGAPLLADVRQQLATLRTRPWDASINYRLLSSLRAYVELAGAMPKPYPFPKAARDQFVELRDHLERAEAHFRAQLEEQARDLRSPDPAELARYTDENARAGAPKPGSRRVVFFGDSITDSWRLNEYYPGRDFLNRGISGQTTGDMLQRFQADVINLKPESVLILAGTNDLARGVPLTAIESNLSVMTDLATLHGVHVILASLLPVNDVHKDENPQYERSRLRSPSSIRQLNQWIEGLCRERKYTFLDYYAALADSSGSLKAEDSDDGLHPNSAGYRIMAPLALAAIDRKNEPDMQQKHRRPRLRF